MFQQKLKIALDAGRAQKPHRGWCSIPDKEQEASIIPGGGIIREVGVVKIYKLGCVVGNGTTAEERTLVKSSFSGATGRTYSWRHPKESGKYGLLWLRAGEEWWIYLRIYRLMTRSVGIRVDIVWHMKIYDVFDTRDETAGLSSSCILDSISGMVADFLWLLLPHSLYCKASM